MPRTSAASPYVTIEGQRLDRKLLQAFEKSVKGAGDGRVSKADVEQVIAKQIRDGGKLTQTEIDTIEYAAKTMNFTDGAKDSLATLAEEMLGRPVFQWGRTRTDGGSSVDVINNPGDFPLKGKALEKAATDVVLHGVEPILGAESGKPLPHLDSGNNGLAPSIITGDKATKAVKLFQELRGDRAHDMLKNFDPAKHTAIFTVGTEDETHIFLTILDRTTGKSAHVGEQNTVDIGYSVDEAKFNEIFGDWKQFTSDPNDPNNEYDYLDGYVLAEWLQEGATMLSVFHYDNESDPDHKRYERLSKAADEVTEKLGDQSYRMPARTDAGKLPVIEDLPTMARLMFEAGRDEDSGIHYQHDNVPIKVGDKQIFTSSIVDEIAKAFVESYPHERGQAALPDLKKQIALTLEALGNKSDISMFQVSSKVKHETDHNKTTDATSWSFMNEKTGMFVSFYARPDLGG